MPSSATVTAKTGPAVQATSLVISNVVSYVVTPGKVLQMVTSDQPSRVLEYDLSGVTTFTTSISGSNYTLTIS